VKLLVDQNLSPSLGRLPEDLYPGSIHVRAVEMQRAADVEVWNFAAANGFTILTKDADFRQRSFTFGPPPKVIWLRVGNRSTREIETLLRTHAAAIATFLQDPEQAFLALSADRPENP
jgi:predicted nuclease of predicted toxin-antitoxin system